MTKSNRRVSALVTELNAASDRMTPKRRAFLHEFVARDFPPDVSQLIEELTPLPEDRIGRDTISNLRDGIRAGFILAVAWYSRELRSNKEAVALLAARAVGAANGRASQQREKADRASLIQSMFNAGIEPAAIAVDRKCSLSTVYRALKPANSKPSKPPRAPKR